MTYILLYLIAIVAANLLVARFGVGMVIVNAFVLIGLDLTLRDKLHDMWDGKNLWRNMLILIGAGSVISYLLNAQAGQVALASFVAFAVAGLADAITYHKLKKYQWLFRVNGSNIAGSMVDSILFPTIAFGAFIPLAILGQFAAKLTGGFLWSLLIARVNGKRMVYVQHPNHTD